MTKYLSGLALVLTLFSCASYTGNFNDSAALNGNNFEITGWAQGQSSVQYVFGIGGLNKDQLVFEAKKNLYKNHPLQKGQSYANVSVDFKTLYVLPFVRRTATINADIVQFYSEEESKDTTLQHLFIDLLPREYSSTSFSKGEEVFVLKNDFLYSGKILSLTDEAAEVSFSGETQSIKSFPISVLFSKNHLQFDSNVKQDQYTFFYKEKEWIKGQIKGVNAMYYLIESEGAYMVQYRSYLNTVKDVAYFENPDDSKMKSQQGEFHAGQEVAYFNEYKQNDAIVIRCDEKSALVYVKEYDQLVNASMGDIFLIKEPFLVQGNLYMTGSKFLVYGSSTSPVVLELVAMNRDYALLLKNGGIVRVKKSKLKPVE